MQRLVLSGINLFEGGPLSIYYDCLDTLIALKVYEKYNITAFVHKISLFERYKSHVELIELPDSRSSYLKRLRYEYFYFNNYSKGKAIDIWISLHDITPRVKSKKLYTYCHNPSPFLKKDLTKVKYSATNVAFSFFYKYVYRINIKFASGIIVQHDWMRKAFLKMYPVKNVIVARPDINIDFEYVPTVVKNKKIVFMFASFPRYFKNFEVICEACKRLGNGNYEIWLTIDGTENAYSKDLRKKYGDLDNIKWLGIQPRDVVFEMYNKADCLIFPSTLESWGLPISEFKITGKPMLLADLPYAHETLGEYKNVAFFDPYNSSRLKELMHAFITDSIEFQSTSQVKVEQPYASNWTELMSIIGIAGCGEKEK